MIDPGPMPPWPTGEVDWHNIPAWGYVEYEYNHMDVAFFKLRARLIEHCTLCGGNHDWRWHYGRDLLKTLLYNLNTLLYNMFQLTRKRNNDTT